jgi:hypothetical protein
MSWRVARSLEVLREEINAAAPGRSTASRESDHNPWVIYGGQGIVRARDFTHDPAGGLDCNVLADRLASLLALGAHPACRSGAYVIWQRRIFSFDRSHEGWRPYYGSNPHDHHCHLSVALDPAGFDSTAPWFVMTEEDDMPYTEAELTAIVEKAASKAVDALLDEKQANGKSLRENIRIGANARDIAREVLAAINADAKFSKGHRRDQ